jgi:adenylylsulfate kinase
MTTPPSAPTGTTGATVLLTGLPGAGKTTLAGAAVDALRAAGRAVEPLDGDVVRSRFWPELGMAPADRERNLDRMSGLAALLARNGVVAVISAIAPFAAARAAMRAAHTAEGLQFLEVHVATSLAECRRRDVKGLYARQARGELVGLTGVDAVYEAPEEPALRIDTEGRPVADSAATLVGFLLDRLG